MLINLYQSYLIIIEVVSNKKSIIILKYVNDDESYETRGESEIMNDATMLIRTIFFGITI